MKKDKPQKDGKPTSDCGLPYCHTWHLYRTERGKLKACDGSTTKRGK